MRNLKLLAPVITRAALLTIGIALLATTAPGAALAAAPPTTTTGGTSSVSDTSATLHGAVNPNGLPTTYHFEWGTTTAYASNGPIRSAGSGTRAVSVHQSADHLTPGATYHYRLVATNSSGTTYGTDRTFVAGHVSPNVSTGPVTYLNSTGAVLNGTVNPNNEPTTWYFEWGNLSSLSQRTAPQSLAATTLADHVAWSLEGLLNPGTVYQYRLVATHPKSSAKSYGTTGIFMTYPSVRPYAWVRAITTPRNRIRYPYTFTTTGSVAGPSWIPAQFACTGEVTLRFYRGARQVRFETAPVQSNCTYSATTVFYRVPGGGRAPVQLKLLVHFVSTPYLANGHPAHDRVWIR